MVYSHHHIYIVYRYTKHTGPLFYSHHHIYIVYRYTKHTGHMVYYSHHRLRALTLVCFTVHHQ